MPLFRAVSTLSLGFILSIENLLLVSVTIPGPKGMTPWGRMGNRFPPTGPFEPRASKTGRRISVEKMPVKNPRATAFLEDQVFSVGL
jgi:hypothetical protein